MDEAAVARHLAEDYADVHAVTQWGDTFFYYAPKGEPADGVYFATLKTADDHYDRFSNLDRPGVFRLNLGLRRATFQSRFPEPIEDTDFTALDTLMAHPVYGPQYWVSVVRPGEATFEALKPLIDEAHALAVSKHERRVR